MKPLSATGRTIRWKHQRRADAHAILAQYAAGIVLYFVLFSVAVLAPGGLEIRPLYALADRVIVAFSVDGYLFIGFMLWIFAERRLDQSPVSYDLRWSRDFMLTMVFWPLVIPALLVRMNLPPKA